MGLSAGGLILGETTDTVRQNANLYLKNEENVSCHIFYRLFAHLRKFVPEIVPLRLKNRNQRVHAGDLRAEGLI